MFRNAVIEELTLYANITLETSGVYDMIDSAVLKDCLSNVLANSEETVYLVLRVEDEVQRSHPERWERPPA